MIKVKRNNIVFIFIEVLLAIIGIAYIFLLFNDDKPEKKIAVIVDNSGSGKWDSFINGLKDSAKEKNIHLIICNTDEIEDYIEERQLITEQLDKGIDGFIIQPSPGAQVGEMLCNTTNGRPTMLVTEDIFNEKTDYYKLAKVTIHNQSTDKQLHYNKKVSQKEVSQDDESEGDKSKSEKTEVDSNNLSITDSNMQKNYKSIKFDNRQLGIQLAEKIISDNGNNLEGKTFGVICSFEKTNAAKQRAMGFCEKIMDSGANVKWLHYKKYSQNPVDIVNTQEKVDFVVALETDVLENICKDKLSDRFSNSRIYGIGGSMAAVSFVDSGKVEAIVAPDYYEIGYKAVEEIAYNFKNKLYSLESHIADSYVIDRSNIYSKEIENYILSLKR